MGTPASWKKGQTGNPNGRPKLPWTDAISEIMAEEVDGVTRRRRIVQKMTELAEAGEIRAAEYLTDREEGRPRQAIEHSGSIDQSDHDYERVAGKLVRHILTGTNGRGDAGVDSGTPANGAHS